MAIGYHLMLRLQDERVLVKCQAERRTLARCVLRVGRDHELLAFGLADNHLHAEAAGDEASAKRFAWRLEMSLSKALRLPVSFGKPRIKAIEDQPHLYSVFGYVFRQEQHHGIEGDPFHEASNLLDLLGMRVVGSYTRLNVRTYLPRITTHKLLGYFGDVDLSTPPSGTQDLAEAAMSAFALSDLRGRDAEVVRARNAAVHAVRAPADEIARALGISPRAVRLIQARPPDVGTRAVRLQLHLRAAVRAASCRGAISA